jgi:pimeloyl-ACP methyl ester carboxylesterase
MNASLQIWTISTVNTNEENYMDCKISAVAPERIPIVWVGGILSGIALLIRNVDALSENGKRPFHAFDPLGFGRSYRPLFSDDPVRAEEQFVESIEEWRKEMGLEKMIFVGHSFGGYVVI